MTDNANVEPEGYEDDLPVDEDTAEQVVGGDTAATAAPPPPPEQFRGRYQLR